VEARLETGRTHQVRIHLGEAGHAVLGDDLYGSRGVAGRSPRLALHAFVLGFEHPITKEALRFEAPLADDLAALWRQVGSARSS
jgi:23S rRNA pseudouridine1911/1915/1917 synthase